MMQKGMYTHYIWAAGSPEEVIAELFGMGIDTVILKVSDGRNLHGESLKLKLQKRNTQVYVNAIKAAGLRVMGLHWCEPRWSTVQQEIDAINKATDVFELSSMVLNVEANYRNLYERTERLIRGLHTGVEYGLSSGRYPDVYPRDIHWSALLEFCTFIAAQVYWYGQHNADYQMRKSIAAYKVKYVEFGLSPDPFYPILPPHKWRNWLPTIQDMNAAVAATQGNVEGFGFWVLRHVLHPDLAHLKKWITKFRFEPKPKIHVDDLTPLEFKDLVVKALQEPAARFIDAEGYVIK